MASFFKLGNLISRAHFIVSVLLQEEEEPLPPHPLQNGISTPAGGDSVPVIMSPTSLAPPTELSPTTAGGGNASNINKTLSPMMPKKLMTSDRGGGGFKGFSRRLSKRGIN